MSILEYTVSVLEAMSEERLKEIPNYFQYLSFRDGRNELTEMLTEDDIDLLGDLFNLSGFITPQQSYGVIH